MSHYYTCPDCGGHTTIAWEGDREILWSCEICRKEGVLPGLTAANTTAPRVDPEPMQLSTPNVYTPETPQERHRPQNTGLPSRTHELLSAPPTRTGGASEDLLDSRPERTVQEIREATDAAALQAVENVKLRAVAQSEEMHRASSALPKPPPESRWRRAIKWVIGLLILAGLVIYAASGGHGDGTHSVRCRDGTYSEAGGHQGACSWHGGIAP